MPLMPRRSLPSTFLLYVAVAADRPSVIGLDLGFAAYEKLHRCCSFRFAFAHTQRGGRWSTGTSLTRI